MERNARLGRILSRELDARKISLRSVSDSTGIPLTTLRRSLVGARSFRVTELDALAAHIGTTTTALIAEADGTQVAA